VRNWLYELSVESRPRGFSFFLQLPAGYGDDHCPLQFRRRAQLTRDAKAIHAGQSNV
jgi:hypothetical protein